MGARNMKVETENRIFRPIFFVQEPSPPPLCNWTRASVLNWCYEVVSAGMSRHS